MQLSSDSREWLSSCDNRAWLRLHEIMSQAVSPYRPSSKSWLVPACGGLARLSLWPEARPSKTLMKLWEKWEFPYDLVCTEISNDMFKMASHTPNIFCLIRCALIGTICTNVEITILLRIRPIIVPLFPDTIPSGAKLDSMMLICFRETAYIRHEAQISHIYTYVSNLLLI